ncbi:restriction endonuclease subunit S [Brevibacterium aurantiacum]|uniref:Type I restriction-modification system, specificity subunit S n=1 Tax=Brevibacterium aurantiacum TaxID=273384 RepID=A0A1D7VZB5_BREAU|nr:restriction endonuclease subunit S [Brevibacterium aurantiacum]AOP52095.1 Type I restriction-modification system, specificity subunit S [Brevibacterium aurantiacum]PCC52543.1 hypothetical protein CIK59_15715 [Brevibacterium aurantiacum]RCS98661.1 restriction endonuclease subunit S [Brevibacterium aurantiacum]
MMTKLGILLDETGGSIKTGPFGTALKAAEYSENGVPLISVGEIGDGRLSIGKKTPRVSEETTERLSEYLLWRGDVVIGRKGAVERSALINEDQDGYFLGSDGMRVRFGDSINSTFMAYQFRSDAVRRWLISHASGTTMASMNQAILSKLPILVPPNRTQQAIAEVLGALDDKIAANERAVKIAAALSSAIYQSFSVRANARIDLRELVDTQYGVTVSADDSSNTKLLRVTDINKHPWISWDEVPACQVSSSEKEKYQLFPGDVVVARMADPGKAAYIDDASPEAVFASYLVRLKPRDTQLSLYLYHFLCSAEYQSYVDQNATGSVQRHLNAKKIVDTSMPVIDGSDLGRFSEQVGQVRSQIGSLNAQSTLLAHTRDELLPLLMSGKISVKDAEKVVSDAV